MKHAPASVPANLLHTLRLVPWSPYAGEFQDITQALLEQSGWKVVRETRVELRGPHRHGRIDLEVSKDGCVAGIELDDTVPRIKSLRKLQNAELTHRLVVLRGRLHGPRLEAGIWITGIYRCPVDHPAMMVERRERAHIVANRVLRTIRGLTGLA